MKSVPRISEAEWEVLGVLWKKSPLTTSQVFDSLCGREGVPAVPRPRNVHPRCQPVVSRTGLRRGNRGAAPPLCQERTAQRRRSRRVAIDSRSKAERKMSDAYLRILQGGPRSLVAG